MHVRMHVSQLTVASIYDLARVRCFVPNNWQARHFMD
jgi:hypothetical protein